MAAVGRKRVREDESAMLAPPFPNASGIDAIDATTGGIKIRLESGDLLVMAGDMQKDFTHELPKLNGQVDGRYAPRLNFTVRRFVAAV
uniref:Alpha-ketoglutarate-dependent dioxygenase AlkB-like domain-containing protein n=1 Tax=viral metagenome TaxID=1070528 RepID=A0A6C0IXQ8_9ZZZZ